MKKLNNKGYITVEILIASIIAAVIAVFLIELTIKLVSKTDDSYIDIALTTDKALIIKNIKENIEKDINNKGIVKNIECAIDTSSCNITFENDDGRVIYIKDNKIKYCSDLDVDCIYEKELNNILSDVSISKATNGIGEGEFIFLQIKGKNIFEEKDYTINIPILNKYVENIPTTNSYTITIERKVGTSSSLSDIIVEENESTEVSVNLIGTNYQYKSIACDNGTPAQIISGPITNRGTTFYSFSIGPVTSSTKCTIVFEQSSGSAIS